MCGPMCAFGYLYELVRKCAGEKFPPRKCVLWLRARAPVCHL